MGKGIFIGAMFGGAIWAFVAAAVFRHLSLVVLGLCLLFIGVHSMFLLSGDRRDDP